MIYEMAEAILLRIELADNEQEAKQGAVITIWDGLRPLFNTVYNLQRYRKDAERYPDDKRIQKAIAETSANIDKMLADLLAEKQNPKLI